MQKTNLLLYLIVVVCLGRIVCGQALLQEDEKSNNETNARHLVIPFIIGDTEDESSDEPAEAEDYSKPKDRLESLFGLLGPGIADFDPTAVVSRLIPERTTTTTTTTTTQAPIRRLFKSISRIPEKLIDGPMHTPMHVINGVIDATRVSDKSLDRTAANLAKVTKTTTNLASRVADLPARAVNVADAINPLQGSSGDGDEEDDESRKPYLSQECSFRIACEIGKASRAMTLPLAKAAKKNKIVRDLQNKYTMAMAYGAVHNHCKRYYCVMTQFFGGPREAGKGAVDMTNRVINPHLYETPI